MIARVRAAAVSKRFVHTTPRQSTLIGRLGRLAGGPPAKEVWALRDVSFELGPGDCLGISGPNGAGKSTLLQIAAGILEPTSGSVEVSGRTGTFFQLLAGAQRDMSVRDNVEICAILMGLPRREALRRMDAMLDFAGLAGYADVRLAELSTGQAARAAVAAALHADSEVLLVDEAISFGDAEFRARCGRAFARLRQEGKIIVLASHDEGLLEALASRRLRLECGRVEEPR